MIYVIEDDTNVRKSLEVLMNSYDLKCQSFLSGDAFLREYKEGYDDLMILDMRINDLDARDFLTELKEVGIEIPIIGITAQDEPEIRIFCQQYGVKSILMKPVDSNALMDLIRYHK